MNTDQEHTLGFGYLVNKYLSLTTNYDSDNKWGAGLTIHYQRWAARQKPDASLSV